CVHNCFHVREIINYKIRLMSCKLIPAPSSRRDRDRPRAESLAARDVARGVANNVDLGRGELPSVLLLRAGASKAAKLVSVTVIIGKCAEFEEMPDAIVLEL